jgi:formate hydrogenlyase subunit 3/multisubunit Na+/H+ antiporter MnhD subunit
MLILSLIMLLVPPDGYKYASVLRGLANYLFWPFGKYVQRAVDAEPESLSNYRVSSEPESVEIVSKLSRIIPLSSFVLAPVDGCSICCSIQYWHHFNYLYHVFVGDV